MSGIFLKQNYKCPWRHLNSCISTQLLLGWQPKICFNYRGLDPHAVCHQTNCTLATLTHPRSLKNRRLENLVLCLNIPQKALLTKWRLLSVAQSQQNWWILCCVFAIWGLFANASRIFQKRCFNGSRPTCWVGGGGKCGGNQICKAQPEFFPKNCGFLDVKKTPSIFCNGKQIYVPVRKPY